MQWLGCLPVFFGQGFIEPYMLFGLLFHTAGIDAVQYTVGCPWVLPLWGLEYMTHSSSFCLYNSCLMIDSISAMSWSLTQRSPTNCGVLCVV